MSIINQALKKAQREQQGASGVAAWRLPASGEAQAPRKRGQALWIVSAALFAMSLGATLHAWLLSPTAHGTVSTPAQSLSDPIPRSRPAPPTRNTGVHFNTARQVAAAVSAPRLTEPRTALAAPVPPVQIVAARPPVPPPTAADYTARGNARYRQGQYDRAVALYQAALALNPLDVKTHNNLGSAYLQLALDDRASAAFQEALRLDSSYGLAYYNLACVQARAGNAQHAATYLQQAMAIEPEARAWARADADFAPVRNTPEFRQLLGSS